MVCTNLKTMNKHCPKLKWTRKKPCHHLTGKPTHYALIAGFPRGSTPADLFLPSNKISNDNYNSNNNNSWFATTWQGGHVGGQNKRIFPRRIYMKIEFSSQRREMLLFLTANMAAVTSCANQQLLYIHLYRANSTRFSNAPYNEIFKLYTPGSGCSKHG